MEGTRKAGSEPFLPRKPLAGVPSEASVFTRSRESFATSSPGDHRANRVTRTGSDELAGWALNTISAGDSETARIGMVWPFDQGALAPSCR
jgi:hypothetical protein